MSSEFLHAGALTLATTCEGARRFDCAVLLLVLCNTVHIYSVFNTPHPQPIITDTQVTYITLLQINPRFDIL